MLAPALSSPCAAGASRMLAPTPSSCVVGATGWVAPSRLRHPHIRMGTTGYTGGRAACSPLHHNVGLGIASIEATWRVVIRGKLVACPHIIPTYGVGATWRVAPLRPCNDRLPRLQASTDPDGLAAWYDGASLKGEDDAVIAPSPAALQEAIVDNTGVTRDVGSVALGGVDGNLHMKPIGQLTQEFLEQETVDGCLYPQKACPLHRLGADHTKVT